jgi:hypothetical protein
MSRYKHAIGPITEEMGDLLVEMIKRSAGREKMFANDILEVMSEARENGEGMRAAKTRLEELAQDYGTSDLSELAIKLTDFFRECNMKSGHRIPEKPYRFTFMKTLNPVEQENVESAIQELQQKNILSEDGKLTDAGYSRLWRDA